MAITSLIATGGAPVSGPETSRLVGFNTVWISGGSREVISLAVEADEAHFDSTTGAKSKNLTLDEDGQGHARVCFVASVNSPATTVLTAADDSPNAWKKVLSFAPLQAGPGKFLWYGAAVGASAGGGQYDSIFVDIDQNPDPVPMSMVAARAAGFGQVLDGDSSNDGKVLLLKDGCAEVRIVDGFPEAVMVRLSLPESPDGEILFVTCSFIADAGLADVFAPLPPMQDAAGGVVRW